MNNPKKYPKSHKPVRKQRKQSENRQNQDFGDEFQICGSRIKIRENRREIMSEEQSLICLYFEK